MEMMLHEHSAQIKIQTRQTWKERRGGKGDNYMEGKLKRDEEGIDCTEQRTG